MIYEETADSIRALEDGRKAHVGDLGAVDLFADWPRESFDEKIEFYESTGETEKAESIRVIRNFCLADELNKKDS